MSTTGSARVLGKALMAFSACLLGPAAVWACPCSEFKAPAIRADIASGVRFSHSAEYRKEFAKAIRSARTACTSHIGDGRVAVVSDIDETLLDNREYISRRTDEDDLWKGFAAWVAQAKSTVLKPTADLLAWARKNGFAIFLITGRTEDMRAATIENLVRTGIAYDGLYMRATGDHRSAVDVKKEFREGVEKLGFKIIVNIGDQATDLAGGHAHDCELLPNKMYLVE